MYIQRLKQEVATSCKTGVMYITNTGRSYNIRNGKQVQLIKQEIATSWQTGLAYNKNLTSSKNGPTAHIGSSYIP